MQTLHAPTSGEVASSVSSFRTSGDHSVMALPLTTSNFGIQPFCTFSMELLTLIHQISPNYRPLQTAPKNPCVYSRC